MLKIGIAGARGLSCMAGFKAMDNVQVTALCDLNAELLAHESKKHGIPDTFRIYEDMLESDIDAVGSYAYAEQFSAGSRSTGSRQTRYERSHCRGNDGRTFLAD